MSLIQSALQKAGRFDKPAKPEEKKQPVPSPRPPAVSKEALAYRLNVIHMAASKAGKKTLNSPSLISAEETARSSEIKSKIPEIKESFAAATPVEQVSSANPIDEKKVPWRVVRLSLFIAATFLLAVFGLFLFVKMLTPQPVQRHKPANHSTLEVKSISIVPKLAMAPDFKLSGITSSGNERLALINNQVVGVGDMLREKATVQEIEGRSVTLLFQGRSIKVSL